MHIKGSQNFVCVCVVICIILNIINYELSGSGANHLLKNTESKIHFYAELAAQGFLVVGFLGFNGFFGQQNVWVFWVYWAKMGFLYLLIWMTS